MFVLYIYVCVFVHVCVRVYACVCKMTLEIKLLDIGRKRNLGY